MRENGNATQWPDGYPGRIEAEEDIARGHCFLVADDEGPFAVFALAPGPDETYAEIDGAWHSEAEYHVIHRVAALRGHGVARAIFGFAAEQADYLRCDTHEDNAPMRRALESFGFRECGTITAANGTQRVAYDWIKEALEVAPQLAPQHARLLPLSTYPTISHVIPRHDKFAGPQKARNFNVLISNIEAVSIELRAKF